MKKLICFLLALCLCFSLCGCGAEAGGYGVRIVQTLEEQEYGIGFRVGDATIYYVSAALQVLNARGKIEDLNRKWFGSPGAVEFGKDEKALELTGMPEPRVFTVGMDLGSFPFAYNDANNIIWGYDVELAQAVCELLGWELAIQQIESPNTYIELSSGNIDCAWGGVAIDPEQVKKGEIEELGPYIHNDIVIVSRAGSKITSRGKLKGMRMAMSTSVEAMNALESDEKLSKKLGKIIRLTGGSPECFQYLYDGKCDVVLTDSTALLYFNNR